jgi:hypothetical protein
MTIIVKYILALGMLAASAMSCGDGTSLQRYLVDKQDDDNFIKVDIATSLFTSDDANFTQEQKDILKTIKKVNVVAFPNKGNLSPEYQAEQAKLNQILDNEKYILLGKVSSDGSRMTMKYLGEEDAIDEVIIYASDDERGFAVFRLLGDDMKPGQMMKLMNSIEKGDLDVSALSGIGELFQGDNMQNPAEDTIVEDTIVESE